ncbi:MAG: hypothetical protein L0271_20605 [Gemmatimonadetes bacterium]|nr:hypothetical protein [Gemmatimonadota bacterium]
MNFVQATNTLINNIRMEDLANEMSVSRGLLAQSRLHPTNPQHRDPPDGWEAAVVKVARRRAEELARLADALSKGSGGRRRTRKSRRTTRAKRAASVRKRAAKSAGRKKASTKRPRRKSGSKRRR